MKKLPDWLLWPTVLFLAACMAVLIGFLAGCPPVQERPHRDRPAAHDTGTQAAPWKPARERFEERRPESCAVRCGANQDCTTECLAHGGR